MIVAITGGIGSGKSSVTEYLVKIAQAEYCDADQYCKELLVQGKAGWSGVVGIWGKRFLDKDGNIDRSLLRKTIFDEPSVRRALEGLLHPLVREHVAALKATSEKMNTLLVVEVPLLFEVGWQDDFDQVITVRAENEICQERVMSRDSVTYEEVEKIIRAQLPIEEKAKLSDYVIDNSGSWHVTCDQVVEVFGNLKKFMMEKRA